MAPATNRFSQHLPRQVEAPERNTLVPDANFSRNVNFHVIRSPEGADLWLGRYLLDLIEVVAECHPEGLLVDVEGVTYVFSVTPAPKGASHG